MVPATIPTPEADQGDHVPAGGGPAPGEVGDPAALSVALVRLAAWLRRNTPRGEFDIVAMSTLDSVATDGPLRVSDLAVRERISQPGMTGVVSRLADAGLVERRADPSDGRAALVAATEAGRAHLAARYAARAEVLDAHIDRLPPEHRQALLAVVGSLNALTSGAAEQPPTNREGNPV